MAEKESRVYRAKLAEQAERYEGTCSAACFCRFATRLSLCIFDGIFLYAGQFGVPANSFFIIVHA